MFLLVKGTGLIHYVTVENCLLMFLIAFVFISLCVM